MNRPLFAASLLLIACTGTALAAGHHGASSIAAAKIPLHSDGPSAQMRPRFNNTSPVGFPMFIVQRGFSDAY